MFRFVKPRRTARTIFSMSRLPLKLENRAQQGKIQNVQKVRFMKPRFPFRSFVAAILFLYVGTEVWTRVVFGPLDKVLEEEVKNMPEEELEEGGLFIPFPGTTKQLTPSPYRGSDPEWQEFIKFSKDQGLAKSVRDELAQFVRQLADKHPGIVIRCGKGMKLRRYWLDVDFPTHPPPEFERSGIEITDDFVSWTKMPVDSAIVFRLKQILWPSALAQSLWAFTRVMIVDDGKRLARMFGFVNIPPPPSMDQLLAQYTAHLKNSGMPTEAGPPKPKKPQPIADSQKTMVTTTVTPEKPNVTRKDDELDMEVVSKFGQQLQAHFFRPIFAFKQKFAQTWRPAPNYPPRGSILVSGLVEIDSPKAWLVFDVKAAWDPKTKSYDARSMQLKLRRMQLKKQGPLGGA